MSKVATSVFSSVAAPLGQIDEVRIIDMGGNGRGLDQFGSIVPNTVFKFLSALKVQGIDLKPLLGKLGISVEELEQLLTARSPETKPVAAKPVEMKTPRPLVEESAPHSDSRKA